MVLKGLESSGNTWVKYISKYFKILLIISQQDILAAHQLYRQVSDNGKFRATVWRRFIILLALLDTLNSKNPPEK